MAAEKTALLGHMFASSFTISSVPESVEVDEKVEYGTDVVEDFDKEVDKKADDDNEDKGLYGSVGESLNTDSSKGSIADSKCSASYSSCSSKPSQWDGEEDVVAKDGEEE